MGDALLVRSVALGFPIAAAGGLWMVRRPNAREATALALAAAWNFLALIPVNLLAMRMGWWTFHAEGGLLFGIPADVLTGWALFWGPAAVIAVTPWRPWLAVGVMLWLDAVLMPACAPVVVFTRGWLAGEALALAVAFAPGLMLARWTAEDRCFPGRATLLAIAFGGLMFLLLPASIVGGTAFVQAVQARPGWQTACAVQVLAAVAVPALSAVQEFAQRGRGTPLPFDPPRALVTSGMYAYVANPMQLATTMLFLGLGLLLHSWWVAGAGVVATAFSAGFAAWSEDADLRARFGDAWLRYRAHVRAWRPRWRPWIAEPARLYVAAGCGPCSQVGRWIRARRPVGLHVVAAQDHPSRDLARITYEPSDGGPEEEGVAALARALEHVHFAWALVGAFVRLPVVRPLAQLLVDAVGGGPTPVQRWAPAIAAQQQIARRQAAIPGAPCGYPERRIEL